ncbi:TIM barrel protein [Herbiconiux sp. KACC 21604]|uniref:sugar phosphate isomerase/epimerase family protein n=1 Tax=unclassified Herbiconiux TaxID=2618217 RepID=UPI001491B017|nr:TIM barrel protein [Herbiconiux sp. SALV-R1]QJU55233.1 sugar phosphate isomerase/epimerase [Herbiconiux sp. SALV-R1]WPO86399.1 TIM barrel protein [Herbiconiux sp. KACC 21604]
MSWAVYGMDVGFYSHTGRYPLRTRCEMLADLGFEATNLTLWSEAAWDELPALERTAAASGLTVASLYLTVDLAAPLDSPDTARALDLIASRPSAPVELTLTSSAEGMAPSDPAGDAAALRFIDEALARSGGDTELRLYPHFAFWMERVSDAVRLASAFDGAPVGLTFPAFHVYALEGTGFSAALEQALPLVRGVNTNGSRRLAGQYFPVTIEPLGDGDFDNFSFLGRLRDAGYDGTVGIQAYGVGGDPYAAFGRSLRVLRDIESRLDAHPEWARTAPETL